jgi:orotidine-5'-phosphate decarboxylase
MKAGVRFLEKLAAAATRNQSHLCVGLDPDPTRIAGSDVAGFNRRIIEATADLVCCYKPNIAFYEALGQDGYDALRATIAAIPRDIPVLIDAKRGDIDSTAERYAVALFDVLGADAVTVNPYLGGDALEPFLRRAERGVFVLCRNSNAGAADLQDLQVEAAAGEREPLYLAVAGMARRWNERNNVGLVVGATYPTQLALVRGRCSDMPILVPGVGTQGGALAESVRAADNGKPWGFLVNSSRGITYAAKSGEDHAGAARAAALRLRDAINDELRAAAPSGG